jgi:hypothetical protein
MPKGDVERRMDLLGNQVELDVRPLSYRSDERFLKVIGVEELRHLLFKKVPAKRVAEISSLLAAMLEPHPELGVVVWVFVFAHGAACTDDAAPRDSVHAVSLFCEVPAGLEHRYFERDGAGFAEVDALKVTMSAFPTLDDIRLLHFAAFTLGELPVQSAFYEFKSGVWNFEDALKGSDYTLREALLLDAERLAGAPALGLYGNHVYAALLQSPGDGAANCGNDPACGAGSNECEPVPQGESAGYRCKAGISGDAWIDIFTQAIEQGLVSPEDVDFPAARTFITESLPQSQRGRQLMALYYALSTVIRTDTAALEGYVAALPSIRAAIRGMLDGPPEAIVISPQLREAWARVTALYPGVPLRPLERMAGALRQIDFPRVMTKGDVLRVLEGGET